MITKFKLFEKNDIFHKWYDAIIKHNLEKIKNMIDDGVDVNMVIDNYDAVALHYACKTLEIFNILIKVKNLDLNKQDIYGNTPLLFSVFFNNYTITKKLLEKGADFKITDNDGNYFYNDLDYYILDELRKDSPELDKFIKKQETIKKFKI